MLANDYKYNCIYYKKAPNVKIALNLVINEILNPLVVFLLVPVGITHIVKLSVNMSSLLLVLVLLYYYYNYKTTLPVPRTAALRTSLISESSKFSSSGVEGRGQPTQSSSTCKEKHLDASLNICDTKNIHSFIFRILLEISSLNLFKKTASS